MERDVLPEIVFSFAIFLAKRLRDFLSLVKTGGYDSISTAQMVSGIEVCHIMRFFFRCAFYHDCLINYGLICICLSDPWL